MTEKILLVDDEPSIVKIVGKRLEAEGFEVITAMDGDAALMSARGEKPALIILDLMLPKMDGYKVCAFLKQDTRYQKIPIILFTARAQESDERLGYECGANAYIKKPFSAQELLEKIHSLLEEVKNGQKNPSH